MEILLNEESSQVLEALVNLLSKDKNTVLDEALKHYLKAETQKIEELKSSQTNLSYDEFWDGVDL